MADPRRTRRLLLLATLLPIGLAGCVSGGTHREVVRERDLLAERTRALEVRASHLETSKQSLQTQLVDVMEQLEDLRIERDRANGELAELRERAAELSEDLGDRTRRLDEYQQKLEEAREEVSRLSSTYTSLVSDLEAEVSSGQIEIQQLREGLRVNVSNEILFASGSAELDSVGREVLGKLIGQLATLDHMIEVQGYTDDRRIRGRLARQYPSNWELAAARAARVVRLMEEKGIAGDRLSVVSFASQRPVAPNDTPGNRALNRRIEIRLYPRPESELAPVRSTSSGRSGGPGPDER